MAQRMPLELYDMWSGYQTPGWPVAYWGPIIKQRFTVKIWEGSHVTCFCSTKGCVIVCFVILHDIFLKFFPKETDDEKTRVCFQMISQVLVRHGSSFMACH